MSHQANSAHFGSSLSCVEIISAILTASNIRPDTVAQPDRDRLIMSKGHAAMGYYAALNAHGLIDDKHLENYLGNGTALWGHVTRTEDVPVIDASTGSLGHGLGLALGYAEAYRLQHYKGRIFCVLSDGELDEGATWEAALYAGARAFDNIVAVVDYNKIQSLDRVDDVLPLAPLPDKWLAFRWSVEEIDGHDEQALIAELSKPSAGKPRVVLAHTVKGKGVPRIENTVASHYTPAQAGDAALFG
jgi:transketolase